MEPLNDNELRDLLRQWEAPAAPQHLERRIFGEPRKQPWYRWLLTGSIRVPVPVFALLLVVWSALTYVLPRARQTSSAFAREVRMSDFQPVAELKPRIIRRDYDKN
jgi:fatty acid desaturase